MMPKMPTPPSPLPPQRSRVEDGKIPAQDSSRVYQGTDPWQVDGTTSIESSTLPEGAASQSTLEDISTEIRTLQVLEAIDEKLDKLLFILETTLGVNNGR